MTKIIKLKNVLWPSTIEDFTEKSDGYEWTGRISSSSKDRDGEHMNQDGLEHQWKNGHYRHNPIVVYMHTWLGGIGYVKEYARDKDDSLARIHLGHDFKFATPWGYQMNVNDIAAQIEQKILRSHSVAINGEKRIHDDESVELYPTDWLETSIVTIPSSQRSQVVSNAMSSDTIDLKAEIEALKIENAFVRNKLDEILHKLSPEVVKTRESEDEGVLEALNSLDELVRTVSTPDIESEAAFAAKLNELTERMSDVWRDD